MRIRRAGHSPILVQIQRVHGPTELLIRKPFQIHGDQTAAVDRKNLPGNVLKSGPEMVPGFYGQDIARCRIDSLALEKLAVVDLEIVGGDNHADAA